MHTYNENNRCPKCDGAATTTHDRRTNTMVRRCVRCEHTWREAPKDRQTYTVHADALHERLAGRRA